MDRPTFSDLRDKFSNLLLAQTDDAYMVLEVDEDKTYYTMGEEEEEEFKKSNESLSSQDSDSSIKKQKDKNKKIEKPKWAMNNAYVSTPSTFKEDQIHVDDEQYRIRTEAADIPEEVALDIQTFDEIKLADVEVETRPVESSLGANTSGSQLQQTTTPVLLEEQVGVPLSFMTGPAEKTALQAPHAAVKKTASNPYVDDPATKVLLPDEKGAGDGHKIGLLNAEIGISLRESSTGPEETMTSL